ncbi:MAG: UbiX family flavin prenyltransferase [Bacteroidales bacterium]|nr:UbiX family flavin prenyltransferase [Bacteroidales bacterium]MBN2758216.1 UbiX family flavin prenyltransferase [Bacteroidales bacterium]
MKNRKIIIAVTGASGSIYAKQLINHLAKLKSQINNVSLVFSKNAIDVWEHEIGIFDKNEIPFKIYSPDDFFAPFASGSAKYDTMIICPCSMGTLGRIAHGISEDLITRAADVILKEKRKLILVTRETPLNQIHINNMKIISDVGGIIFPASPSFYSLPQNITELVDTVVNRILDLADIEANTYRWGEND